MKPVIPREAADTDIDQALAYYTGHAPDLAPALLDALEAAFKAIAGRPTAGSPRFAHELDLQGLRGWIVKRFPYIVFYIEHEASIDVLRVLHQRRDIPAELTEAPIVPPTHDE
jgi:toxin ParE1/3/4